jgi:multisubunit Na+/H+ antiporter MnhC subunit
MASFPGTVRLGPLRRPSGRVSTRGWRWTDRLAFYACWAAGIALCVIAGAIVIYMLVRGVQYVSFSLLFTHPSADANQAHAGGFLDPLLGTLILTVVGISLATPLAVAIAVWLVEYGKPTWLARPVESGIEVVAGTPSIVLAIFGLVLFQQHIFAFLSFTAQGGAVFARSFITAGARMSLLARGSAGDPAPCARGLIRARQDSDRDDPPRAAAGRAARHRHRRRARDRADRRRHSDRRDPARRHADAHADRRRAAAAHPARRG